MLNEFYGLTPRGKPTTATAQSNWRITARSSWPQAQRRWHAPASRAAKCVCVAVCVRGVLIKDLEMSIMARISRKALNERRSVHCLRQLGARWWSSCCLAVFLSLSYSICSSRPACSLSAFSKNPPHFSENPQMFYLRWAGQTPTRAVRIHTSTPPPAATACVSSASPSPARPFPSDFADKAPQRGWRSGGREENHRSCT